MKPTSRFLHRICLSTALIFSILLPPSNSMANTWVITFGFTLYSPNTLPNVAVGDTIIWQGSFLSHPLQSTSVPPGASTFFNNTGTSFGYVVNVQGTYSYQCNNHAVCCNMTGSFDAAVTGVVDQRTYEQPSTFRLDQNFPNPFNPSTSIQLKIDANVELTATQNQSGSRINTNFRDDDPFNPLRAKIFVIYNFNPTFGIETEILFDNHGKKIDRSKDQPVRIDGLFLSIHRAFRAPVNLWIGRIPTPVGGFTARSYPHINPLIGFPLMYQYKLPINPFDVNDVPMQRAFRDGLNRGATMVYEACWINGVSVFGTIDRFNYMVAVAKGTLSNPEAIKNKGVQIAGRIGVKPLDWLNIGISAAIAPYLENGASVPAGTAVEDVKHRLVGLDAQAIFSHIDLHGEVMYNNWDTPRLLDSRLSATSWFLEGKFSPFSRFYIALRIDRLVFGDMTANSTGDKEPWGYNVSRQEFGLGFRIIPEFTIKAVVQHNVIAAPTETQVTIYAVQGLLRVEDIQNVFSGGENKIPEKPKY